VLQENIKIIESDKFLSSQVQNIEEAVQMLKDIYKSIVPNLKAQRKS